MLTHRQRELKVVEGNICNCFHPTWKLASCAMTTKVSQTASWFLMCSLLWAQHKSWIPIRLMRCVHPYRKTLALKDVIVQTVFEMEKIGEDNRKVKKIGQVIN
jgi:hypothetical protein